MRVLLLALYLALTLASGAERAAAAQVHLEVASLTQPSFEFYIRGRVGRGDGELAMSRLDGALQAAAVPAGAMLYDRDLVPADADLARSFGTVPVRVTGVGRGPSTGGWQSLVSWDAAPGQRAVWVLQPTTSHLQRVRHLAISARSGELRYYIPYRVSLFGKPQLAPAYPLYFLQAGEGSERLWIRSLAPRLDLGSGIATVVGQTSSLDSGDWVYIVVASPAEAVTFRVVVGWGPRGSPTDEAIAGAGGGARAIRP
jgi:hypothetical protein